MKFCFASFAFIICSVCFIHTDVRCQGNKGNNYFRDFQAKPYYLGLTFGYNHSKFQIFHSRNFILNDSFRLAEVVGSPGLNVSVIGNLKLGEYFDFRMLPGFSFATRKLFFVSAIDEKEHVINIESVFFQMPFQLRFKSDPFKDKRVYILAGAKYTYDGAASGLRPEQAKRKVRISPHDFSIEAGAGCQFYFPFFIFSPEIKYSHGFGNILIHNRNLTQTSALEKILSRTFTISFHFEG